MYNYYMISAVVHTFNEEENIDRCLSSLSFADEVILVDMGSTDRTLEKASNYTAKIFNFPYTGFVEPARNFGLEKTKSDWIIILDADEEIGKTLREQILKTCKSGQYDYYRIPRKNIIFNKWVKHAGWWPDFQIRLFKKGKVTWTDRIHGVPLTTGSGVDFPPQEGLAITHYNYRTVSQYLERLNRYTSITAKELFVSNQQAEIKSYIIIPMKEFVTRYFVWEGYKDGIHGLLLSLLQSFSELMVQIKLWELSGCKQTQVDLQQLDDIFNEANKSRTYWLTSVLLSKPHSAFQDFLLRLRRKFPLHA